ncbi:glycoside hydrolase family 26 protein [Alkalitalea saponilacus]|uniref:Mannan endo-1,4-beta-mannosidase n=1 Tax=Alkalitalea saponilacus TaxID=889453 RepID=A0A1T5CLR4_9BACT|nr:glycosyl hydrolase [Alkalitalea saponilacus]ASB49906.1 beta-mannosidase [Alkalitalea saponilacus]SKB60334.1 mannan endo-1,4-beta-mannosidase [Alkalitalea saponilacus]
MHKNPICLTALIITVFCGCNEITEPANPIDKNATPETVALFQNLMKISENHVLFGHQHATEYGQGWYGDDDRSDVKSVTGSHPAVIGIDFMHLSNRSREEIETEKERLRKNVVDTYNRGGITTATWHFHNPVSEGRFYWVDSVSVAAVQHIIPGGYAHEDYKVILADIADWAHSIRGEDGTLIPIIFRPFHEFDGDWFWWGKAHTSREDFVSLWQFTVSFLRDSLNVNNFLYAFSPDNRFETEEEFLERYPGDEWVDMLGMDNYGDLGRDRYDLETASQKLMIVSDYAKKVQKLAAFTETGLESIPDTTWWTNTLLEILKTEGMRMSYVLVWRNDVNSPTHYYAPFPGQVSAPNFIEFYNDPFTIFENDLKEIDVYRFNSL